MPCTLDAIHGLIYFKSIVRNISGFRILLSHVGIYHALVNFDDNTARNFHFYFVCIKIDMLYSTVDATTDDDLCTIFKGILELTNFLLLFLLWTNHEKPHDYENGNHHNKKSHVAA